MIELISTPVSDKITGVIIIFPLSPVPVKIHPPMPKNRKISLSQAENAHDSAGILCRKPHPVGLRMLLKPSFRSSHKNVKYCAHRQEVARKLNPQYASFQTPLADAR